MVDSTHGYRTDELDFKNSEVTVCLVVSGPHGGKYYVFCKNAFAPGATHPSDFYLHKDGCWHTNALPGGYFETEEEALVALRKHAPKLLPPL